MTDFYSPLPSYDLVRAAEMLTDKGANCTGNDLLELWSQGVIELCFSLPDYIAIESIDTPGEGKNVLLSVSPDSFNRFWHGIDYPPDLRVNLAVKEYGSDSGFCEQRLWIPTDPQYNIYDDGGKELCEALRDTYSREKLRIPGAELQKVWRFLTCQPIGELKDVSKKGSKSGGESAKTVNYLATALKAFIHIHYGADVVENLRKHLEDPTSEIRKDFANKELKAPGGKALADHLKTILLDVVPALENVDVERDAGEK